MFLNSSFFQCYGQHRDLHSFPTRRSSDLALPSRTIRQQTTPAPVATFERNKSAAAPSPRSEEHTSELQSRGHLVCRLLLEKKKQNIHLIINVIKILDNNNEQINTTPDRIL